ncbi:MAG: hypothetical protein R3D44_12830 [Hyphomicrobiaceae bacterium]
MGLNSVANSDGGSREGSLASLLPASVAGLGDLLGAIGLSATSHDGSVALNSGGDGLRGAAWVDINHDIAAGAECAAAAAGLHHMAAAELDAIELELRAIGALVGRAD